MSPARKLATMTRDTFDPVVVLGQLKCNELSPDDLARLLQEACHVIERQRLECAERDA